MSDALVVEDSKSYRLDSDLCMMGSQDYLIPCVLEIPIAGTGEFFGWGVWATQSEANFRDYVKTFPDSPERTTFGYLWNRLPLYADTVGLKAQVRWRPKRER